MLLDQLVELRQAIDEARPIRDVIHDSPRPCRRRGIDTVTSLDGTPGVRRDKWLQLQTSNQ